MLNSSCWILSFMKLISSLHWIFFAHTTWIIVWLNKTFMKRTRKKKMGISMQILKLVGDKESKKSYRISSYVISKADCFFEWAKYIMWCFWLDFRHSIMNEYIHSHIPQNYSKGNEFDISNLSDVIFYDFASGKGIESLTVFNDCKWNHFLC